MGVSGLLPILKPVIEDAHVRDFAGKKLAIDAFAWLHKAAFTCAYELAMGMPTDKYVHYIMQRVEMMRSLDVTPLLVFDGMSMPAKKVTNDQRSQMRSQHIARGQALAHEGNRTAATDAFQKGISIRSDMIRRTQRALREAGVEFIVAPYEADVQMAYMNREGLVDGVVTEDSDLVVYGAKRILFKMDKHGAAQLYCESSRGSIDSPSMRGFTNEDFVYMCILAGCDMLPSMPGMGIKKAAHLLSTYKKIDRVFNRIRHMDTFDMPEDYTDDFWKAFLTFRHARAYDPRTKRLDYLNQLPKHWDVDGEDGEEAIGPEISDELARGIATGEINPRTRKPYDADVQKPSRTARLVPRAPVVERPNRSMDSYVRKQEPKQQNQPAPLAQGQAKQGVKRRAQPLHPKGGSSARRARSSAPVTPAASPEAADLRPQTANPFVETQVPAPVPAAKQAAAEAKSRFFAARPAPAAPAAAPAPALAPASASSSPKPPLFVPESPLQSEMPPPQAEPRAREAEQTNLFSVRARLPALRTFSALLSCVRDRLQNYRHNDPQAPVSATSATSATAKHRPTERGRKSGQGAATASKPSSSCPVRN